MQNPQKESEIFVKFLARNPLLYSRYRGIGYKVSRENVCRKVICDQERRMLGTVQEDFGFVFLMAGEDSRSVSRFV